MASASCGPGTGAVLQGSARQHSRMSTDDIAAIVTALGDLVTVVRQAEPADKAEIYGQIGLTLTLWNLWPLRNAKARHKAHATMAPWPRAARS
jgi:hypothetical protein